MDAIIGVRELKGKVRLGLQIQLTKNTTSRRPDLVHEGKEEKRIGFVILVSSQQINIKAKHNEEYTKFRHLVSEMRVKAWVSDIDFTDCCRCACWKHLRRVTRS